MKYFGPQSSGRGRVKDPANDRRLKINRENAGGATPQRKDTMLHGQGRVKDPTKDRRLKINRDKVHD